MNDVFINYSTGNFGLCQTIIQPIQVRCHSIHPLYGDLKPSYSSGNKRAPCITTKKRRSRCYLKDIGWCEALINRGRPDSFTHVIIRSGISPAIQLKKDHELFTLFFENIAEISDTLFVHSRLIISSRPISPKGLNLFFTRVIF